ncbi:three-Cys-motif partner protein TcmP [Pseudomonas granadensis]|uniref:three-Cys-motif partner protein TcmP n=1 Tax=Pseudomonas granadensis TaxID=1421430 RepID=UPI0019CFF0BF|nr:three-Cys-motif partner protein TcmP [Pseudomonas granadensis]MBN6774530.1 three-Cys-motif partner protein TcmP [Pseudomonas granadensis]MBN6805670.1 three-Cys-motif partner protein TcmP [Pseudomonas granadensis]MBN6832556.1 three-Cys-motif partner protein TcmP [Pseudomonas granadensis]MBN6839864.1 three-Cys-motif partner protein TcmP [Pseudomonas granadensis]MBN6869239.1 three-Cys-motif partner protein TcmP [Pseudomonas granadensis]
MAEKKYAWEEGATLAEHSRKKHQILREYFYNYVKIRCTSPLVRKFRLAVVDGFSGAGRYNCGAAGSPIIFVEELSRAITDINLHRAMNSMPLVDIECSLILNDADKNVIELLKVNLAPALIHIKLNNSHLKINTHYFSDFFEEIYPTIKSLIRSERHKSIIFNLDQCGHSHVRTETLIDMMGLNESVEVFYTFVITALLAFLEQNNPKALAAQLSYLQLTEHDFGALVKQASKREWLGIAERIVFDTFQKCAKFVSPFSINNPDGWRYWLIHLANSHRARQVYNDILHQNSETQAHYGRSGLNMLAHDPSENKTLYLFDASARDQAKDELQEDIPRFICDSGQPLSVKSFYEMIYNHTPAHSDDINSAIIGSNELVVKTSTGGTRRKPSQINTMDYIEFKKQRSFLFK